MQFRQPQEVLDGAVERVAFFGGTFDPPHRGHLAVARAAADHFRLHRVLLAPVGRQPLKQQTVASYQQRLQLVELLCAEDSRFQASALDAPRADGEGNFTVDTLERLTREQARERQQLFAIAGADSFHSLSKWREPHRLIALAEWIVISRPGFPLDDAPAPEGMSLSAAERARIHPLRAVDDPVSASELRERLELGLPCDDFLPKTVAAYIVERGLYQHA